MTKEETTKEATKLIAEAMREALSTIASEKIDAKRQLAFDAEKAIKVIATEKEKDAGSFQNILYKQVSFGLSIVGVLFGAFIFLTSPSQKNDTALQLQDARITAQRDTIDTLTKTAQNDTQEVKKALEMLTLEVNEQQTDIATLTAIINERIPARK